MVLSRQLSGKSTSEISPTVLERPIRTRSDLSLSSDELEQMVDKLFVEILFLDEALFRDGGLGDDDARLVKFRELLLRPKRDDFRPPDRLIPPPDPPTATFSLGAVSDDPLSGMLLPAP